LLEEFQVGQRKAKLEQKKPRRRPNKVKQKSPESSECDDIIARFPYLSPLSFLPCQYQRTRLPPDCSHPSSPQPVKFASRKTEKSTIFDDARPNFEAESLRGKVIRFVRRNSLLRMRRKNEEKLEKPRVREQEKGIIPRKRRKE